MVERTSYAEGEPCWVDLMARDPEAERQFYASVFDWTYLIGGPELGHYTICMANGGPVAGLMGWEPEMGDTPTMWSLYLATRDIDATVARMKASGGQIVVEPMEVPRNGRMAFGIDPAGAAVGLWQAAEHIGFGRVGEPGAFSWGELVARDSAIDGFYQKLFDYEQKETGEANFDYSTWSLDGAPVCGRMVMPAEMRERGTPAHWGLYFTVEDTDAACSRVTSAGGTVTHQPHDSPYGRLASASDPEGASFHLIDPSRTGPRA